MMETLNNEETIDYARVSDSVSKLLETMATQFHSQLSNDTNQAGYKITILDSNNIPDISIRDYLYRVASMSKCIYRDVIVALVYADKLINLEVISGISFYNIHRLMAICLMISAKFFDDTHYSNKFWAQISGLSLQELNSIETQFLEALGYDLNITLEAMHQWAEAVASFADENTVQERRTIDHPIEADSATTCNSVCYESDQFCNEI
jgi:hypothetical protein